MPPVLKNFLENLNRADAEKVLEWLETNASLGFYEDVYNVLHDRWHPLPKEVK